MSNRAAFLGTPFAYFLEWRQAAMEELPAPTDSLH